MEVTDMDSLCQSEVVPPGGPCRSEVVKHAVALVPEPQTDTVQGTEARHTASPLNGELGMGLGLEHYDQLSVHRDGTRGSRSSSLFSVDDDASSTACLSIAALSSSASLQGAQARSTTSLNTQISYVTVGQYEPISPCSSPTTPTPAPVDSVAIPSALDNAAFEPDSDCACGGAADASPISGHVKDHRRYDSGSSLTASSPSPSPRFPCLLHNRVSPGGAAILPGTRDGPSNQFPSPPASGPGEPMAVSLCQPPDVQEVKVPPPGYPEVSLDDTLPHKFKLVKTNSVATDISTGSKTSAVSRAISWDERTCRICWLSEEAEAVIQPCYCSGSSAWVHASCLQKWLQLSNAKSCEICMFQFQAKKRMKPLSQWQWRPGKTRQLAQLEATIILLGVVTPPLLCGIILCSQKIRDYMYTPENAWKTAGLMTLVLVSVVTYLGAVVYFLRKVKAVCRSWIATNRQTVVTLVSANGRRDEQVWSIT